MAGLYEGQFSDVDELSEPEVEEDILYDGEEYYIEIEGDGCLTSRLNDFRAGRHKCNTNPASASSMQPKLKMMQNNGSKIVFEKFGGIPKCAGSVTNQLSKFEAKQHNKVTNKDRQDRATVEQVLDTRTIFCLEKTIKHLKLNGVYGCISTGKEANVYYADDNNCNEFAIKIYKTSVMSFRNRQKYVEGSFSFRNSYSKPKNSRKMVHTWAEKECKNLRLLSKFNINSPGVIDLKENVLTMRLIGEKGIAAPKLKDAVLTVDEACEVYIELVNIVRKLYRKCKLVHADLSEYNVLFFKGKPYIIDVSQSVGPEHPCAFEFLKKDLTNITNFFVKKGVHTMLLSQFFFFVVSEKVQDEDVDSYLSKVEAKNKTSSDSDPINEEVFRHIYIPRYLSEVTSFEKDYTDFATGRKTIDDLPYMEVLGLNINETGPRKDEEEAGLSEVDCLLEKVEESLNDRDNLEECLNIDKDELEKCLKIDNIEGTEECPMSDKLIGSKENSVEHDHNYLGVVNLHMESDDEASETSDECDSNKNELSLAQLKLRRRPPGRDRNETKEEKLTRLHALREENADRRKEKMKKKVKAQIVKRTKGGKKGC